MTRYSILRIWNGDGSREFVRAGDGTERVTFPTLLDAEEYIQTLERCRGRFEFSPDGCRYESRREGGES